jgi:hypothetical protein
MSLEAIECVCKQEKSNVHSGEKASNKGKKENKKPGTKSMSRVPKKACTEKHFNLCKKCGGAQTTDNMRDCRKYEKDGKEKTNFCTAKKGRKKPNPAR